MKKATALLLTAAMTCTLLTGCGGSSNESAGNQEEKTESQQQKEVTLNLASMTYTNGPSLDPAIDYCGSRNAFIGVCETLMKTNETTLEAEPHLAESCEQIDELTWKITIRDGIEFTNGKKLDAAAVKAAFEYELESLVRLSSLLDVASIEADGQVLTIKTNSPVALLPKILSDTGMIVFDVEGSEDYSTLVIGTGPYKIENVDAEGNCNLVRNEKYWQGMPAADYVNAKCINDASAISLALQSGEVDFSTINLTDSALFEGNDDYEIMEYENGRLYFLYLNPEYTFTQDPALREALTYAFDKEAFVNAVYNGKGAAADTIFPVWSGFSSESVKQEGYDPEKTKQILADAGYTDSDGDGFVEKDGEKVMLNITTYDSNNFTTLSEVIQASLKTVGIDSTIVVSDSIMNDLGKNEFNIGMLAYSSLTMGDSYNYLNAVFRSDGSANFSHFNSENADAILDELKVTSDTDKRKELSIKLQEDIFAANQHVFLLHPSTLKVIRKGTQNVTEPLVDNSIGFGDYFNLWKVTK